MANLYKRIEELNEAYLSIRNALKVVKFNANGNDANHTFLSKKEEQALKFAKKLVKYYA